MALCLFLIGFITSSSISPWWRHSVHLYYRAWQSEHGGCYLSLQGTGTCCGTFAVALSIYFLCGYMKFYTMTKCYFTLLAHVLLVMQLVSPACKSLITVLIAAVLKQGLLHLGKRGL